MTGQKGRTPLAREIEAKFRLTDPEAIRRALRRCGAICLGAALETNRFFDSPDAELHKADRALRVRVADPVSAADAEGRTADAPEVTVTYKGPQEKGPSKLKVREEIQFHADSAAAAVGMLIALGLVNTMTFQKRRESWALDDCRVELDELPALGRFMEIEGPSADAIAKVTAALGLAEAEMIRTPYSLMLQAYRVAKGLGDEALMF